LKDEAEEWSSRYAESITNGTGQFCTNPGLILALDSSSLDGFIELLSKKVEEKEASCMLHPEIKRSFSELKQTILNQEGVEQFTESVNSVKDNYADQTVVKVKGETFLRNNTLHNEVFGPFSMVVSCEDTHQMVEIIEKLEGQLTGTIIAQDNELSEMVAVVSALQYRVGRLIFNGVPTGVEVCPSMNHGGPYPASTDSRFTAVGIHSVQRWIRPVTFQNFPFDLLPTELR
jgi:NADP-dependent aldehyde dehydrogenase